MEATKLTEKMIEEAFKLFELNNPENRAYLTWLRLLAQPEPKRHYVLITTGSTVPVGKDNAYAQLEGYTP